MARNLDPAAAATKWATRMGQAGPDWTAGIANPRVAPNANPAAMASNYLAGTAAAGPTYTAGVSSPDFVNKWQAGAKAKVGSFSGAGALHKSVMATALGKIFPMIQQALSGLAPKGPKGTNSARGQQFGEAMHALKGQGKVR